jgi:hypothetical protein
VTALPTAVVAGAREAFTAGYEELRRVALERAAGSGRGIGFALFIRSGMAAWMKTCAALLIPRTPTARRPAVEPPPVAPDVRVEVAMLLAEMALSVHVQGGMIV